MKNKTLNILIIGLVCLIAVRAHTDDKFRLIKNNINSAAIVQLDVLITVKSKVFNDTDSATGEILLADDGRYRLLLNDDIYLNDGEYNWEYSAENNQATKRAFKEGEILDNRLGFFKNIDSYYFTNVVKKDSEYYLSKIDDTDNALPDDMTIYLKKDKDEILKIEYYDLNDDLNCIYINSQNCLNSIKKNSFEISLPDSTEIISLP